MEFLITCYSWDDAADVFFNFPVNNAQFVSMSEFRPAVIVQGEITPSQRTWLRNTGMVESIRNY